MRNILQSVGRSGIEIDPRLRLTTATIHNYYYDDEKTLPLVCAVRADYAARACACTRGAGSTATDALHALIQQPLPRRPL